MWINLCLISLGLLSINYQHICKAEENSTIEFDEIEKDEQQLKIDREKFEAEKNILRAFAKTDVIELNIGGEIIVTTRETPISIPNSLLSTLFNGRWEYKLQRDENENIFLDFNPILFRHLLDQLQLSQLNTISPPSDLSLVRSFQKMIKKLRLEHLLPSRKHSLTLNVNGQIITSEQSNMIRFTNQSKQLDNAEIFMDYHPKLFRHFLKLQRENKSHKIACQKSLLTKKQNYLFRQMLKTWKIFCLTPADPPIDVKWNSKAMTVAAGNGDGQRLDQVNYPRGIDIDDEQTIYIADSYNDRIVEWKKNVTIGIVIAGGNGEGDQVDQFNNPLDVIIDYHNDALLIADWGNRRVVRWPRRNGRHGQTIISNVRCFGLAINSNGDIYVVDDEKDEVRRWTIGDKQGILVAGGNGRGERLNQLNRPHYIFVDDNESVYVSDWGNHRVMKWMKGAKEGIVVAGGQGRGNSLTQLYVPNGIFVDQLETVYVADYGNDRIVRWLKDSRKGEIVVNGKLDRPYDLAFDEDNNIYVVDNGNDRVQKFTPA